MLERLARLLFEFLRSTLVGVIGFSSVLFAVTAPDLIKNSSQELDYLMVQVNGQGRMVKAGSPLMVVKGDKVIIDKASLVDGDAKIANVNLVGYESAKAKRPAEDRGFVVDTSKDLVAKWSVDKKGERYLIKAFSGKTHHGEVFLQLLAPELRYAVLKINGETSVLREKELVKVKASDEVKVEQVVTNVENDTEAVTFQIVPAKDQNPLNGVKFYEIRFSRNDQVFARIPLQVEGT